MAPNGHLQRRRKVAIVGSGCAGLGASWALKDTDYEIHLFEKNDRLGGHTNTQTFVSGDESIPVDTGFIVMNTATYPNFINFLKHVGVDTVPTEMTFAVSRDHGKFEWSGEGKGVFAQRRNIFRPSHWRLIFDVIRFNQYGLDLLSKDDDTSRTITLGKYLDRNGYSQAFRDDYLIPMTAAVWSTSPDKASLDFPAQTLIRFMWNHHLLSTLAIRPDWLTIPGGSQRYIDAVISGVGKKLNVHHSCDVINLARPPVSGADDPVRMTYLEDGNILHETFDHVVLACHGDQVLRMIEDSSSYQGNGVNGHISRSSKTESTTSISQKELEIFSRFQTTENICYLHSDLSQMPIRRKTWSSWNYLTSSSPSKLPSPAGVSLTYNLNILQHIPEQKYGPVLVTMNPDKAPKPELTQGKYIYRHPLYTVEAVQAQERLKTIQGVRGVSYCGAWTRYGFHEDGFSSGLKVAIDQLGAKLPFEFVDSTYSRGHKPDLNAQDYLLRALLQLVYTTIIIGELIGRIPLVWIPVKMLLHLFNALLLNLERSGTID